MSDASPTLSRLASSLGCRNEQPNIDLALELSRTGDQTAILELVGLTRSGKKKIRHDAIKVLYELGTQQPDLLAPYIQDCLNLLGTNDNRMLWGTLQALDTITLARAETIAANLNLILEAADRSSVIAKDKTMSILAKLNGDQRFSKTISPVILQRLTHAATNQFPMYAELAAATMPGPFRPQLLEVIAARRAQMSYPAKQKRLDKLLARLEESA